MESAKKHEAEPLAAMDQVKAIAIEMKKALLAGDLDRFGDMLHEGWLQKKKMAKGITHSPHRRALRRGAQGRGHRRKNHRAQAAAVIFCSTVRSINATSCGSV